MNFRFKQFIVQQELAAMKVGTDSILLGAWANINAEVNSILDIGAGTGILSLMCAQRSTATVIDAVELEDNAFVEAVSNFENSPWADRLFCYHSSIQEFALEIDTTYDFIIANPPFFSPSAIQEVSSRTMARQTHLLNHMSLLKAVKSLLHSTGTFAVIIPFDMESFFCKLATNMGLYVCRTTRVKDTFKAPVKRSLLQFSFQNQFTEEHILILKDKQGVYSEEFKALTQDYYLNF